MDLLASANEPLAQIARDYLAVEGIQNPSQRTIKITVAAIKRSPTNSKNVVGRHIRADFCTIHVPEDDAKVQDAIQHMRAVEAKRAQLPVSRKRQRAGAPIGENGADTKAPVRQAQKDR